MPVPSDAEGMTSNYGGEMPMLTMTYYTLTACAKSNPNLD